LHVTYVVLQEDAQLVAVLVHELGHPVAVSSPRAIE
jgi:hypothetical protein